MVNSDFIIILAWPEGMVTAAGAWYDKFFARNGKYRVGHSALALVDAKEKKIEYLDFGRYQTPQGFARIRDSQTDPDTIVQKTPVIKGNKIKNIKEILIEISKNKSYHTEGALYASVLSGVNINKGLCFAREWQDNGLIPYGPFVRPGTNCSRFVAKIIRICSHYFLKNLRLKFPFSISPSPKRNVSISNKDYYIVGDSIFKKIERNYLHAYFVGIERAK